MLGLIFSLFLNTSMADVPLNASCGSANGISYPNSVNYKFQTWLDSHSSYPPISQQNNTAYPNWLPAHCNWGFNIESQVVAGYFNNTSLSMPAILPYVDVYMKYKTPMPYADENSNTISSRVFNGSSLQIPLLFHVYWNGNSKRFGPAMFVSESNDWVPTDALIQHFRIGVTTPFCTSTVTNVQVLNGSIGTAHTKLTGPVTTLDPKKVYYRVQDGCFIDIYAPKSAVNEKYTATTIYSFLKIVFSGTASGTAYTSSFSLKL